MKDRLGLTKGLVLPDLQLRFLNQGQMLKRRSGCYPWQKLLDKSFGKAC